MKKVLFYTDTPLLGGAENQMLLLAKFLPKEFWHIEVACSCNRNLNSWCRDFMQLGIKVLRLKVAHKHDPRHFLYLKRILPQFDILHMHVWNPASCRFGFLAAGKIPLVITEHDPFPLTGLKALIKQKLLKKVKRVIVASNAAKKLFLQQKKELEGITRVIPNGIDIDEWRKESALINRFDFRRERFKINVNEKIILCAAELHERKGQKYLISAMKKISEEFPDAKLVFAGSGPKLNYYKKLAAPLKEKVLFLGQSKDIAKFMSAADLFVLPSVREAFGLVLLEAAISGVPVIASNAGGIPEIIENGKTGLLFESQNPNDLARAILELLKDPSKASFLAKEAISRVEMKFNARTMAQNTAQVYDEILNS